MGRVLSVRVGEAVALGPLGRRSTIRPCKGRALHPSLAWRRLADVPEGRILTTVSILTEKRDEGAAAQRDGDPDRVGDLGQGALWPSDRRRGPGPDPGQAPDLARRPLYDPAPDGEQEAGDEPVGRNGGRPSGGAPPLLQDCGSRRPGAQRDRAGPGPCPPARPRDGRRAMRGLARSMKSEFIVLGE